MNNTSVISPLFDILPNICNEAFRSKLIRESNQLRFAEYSPASYVDLEPNQLDITYHWTYQNCGWSSIVIQDNGVVDIHYMILGSSILVNPIQFTLNINTNEEELFMISTVEDIKELTIEDIKIIKDVWSFYFERL